MGLDPRALVGMTHGCSVKFVFKSFLKAYRPHLGLALAALLWSLSGAFTKLLTRDDSLFAPLGFAKVPIDPLHIAFGRPLAGALFLGCFLKPQLLTGQWAMIPTAICFALMNVSYVTAMVMGSAANAVLLQYTSPFWLLLGAFWLFGDKPKVGELLALLVGLFGVFLIVFDPATEGEISRWEANVLALASGFFFAGVVLGLRRMRGVSPLFLTVINMGFAALVLTPFIRELPMPNYLQTVTIILYGILQFGLPYLLTASSLKHLRPVEAGLIMLLEPMLNPIWAWLVCPATESMDGNTLWGGVLILGAIAFRYVPTGWLVRPNAPRPALDQNPNRSQNTLPQ